MPFTFECGACHAVYRLDDEQITPNGVKVTCPRCLNYFVLKRGAESQAERPTVERVVSDGRYEIYMPPPSPSEATVDKLLTDKDLEDEEAIGQEPIVTLPQKNRVRTVPGLPPKSSTPVPPPPPAIRPAETAPKIESAPPRLTRRDLGDYPPDKPPQTAVDQYLMPVSLILISLMALLYFNYEGYIRIPGLSKLRAPTAVGPTPLVPLEHAPAGPETPKFGFPAVEPGYDPWRDRTPTPSDEQPQSVNPQGSGPTQ